MRKRYDELIARYNRAFNYGWNSVIYYPVQYSSESKVLKAIKKFEENHIYPRRYFYPQLNKVFGGKKCPFAEDMMSRILCLPLYYTLTDKEQDKVIKIAQATL